MPNNETNTYSQRMELLSKSISDYWRRRGVDVRSVGDLVVGRTSPSITTTRAGMCEVCSVKDTTPLLPDGSETPTRHTKHTSISNMEQPGQPQL